jgi:hypothetical protein
VTPLLRAGPPRKGEIRLRCRGAAHPAISAKAELAIPPRGEG